MTWDTETALTVLGAGMLLLVAGVVLWMALARRRHGREVRELVLAVEEMRSGHWKRDLAIDGGSPLALVSDAVQRLGHDLSVRWREAEGAGRQLDMVMDAAKDMAIAVVDNDLDVRSLSAGGSALLGWDETEIVGKPLAMLFPDEAWKEFLPKLSRRSLREIGIETHTSLRRKNGESFDGRAAVRSLRSPSGDPMGLLIVMRDRTAQARLEQELRRSESRYRQLVESFNHGVFILRDGCIAYANPALEQALGVAGQDLEGVRLRDLVELGDVLVAEEALAELAAGTRAETSFAATLGGGGERAALQAQVTLAAIEYGGQPAVLGTIEDRTEMRRAARELQHNETQLDAVLEGTSDPILLLSDTPEGGVVHLVNSAFLALSGLGERELLGASEGRLLRLLRESGGGSADLAAFIAASGSTTASEVLEFEDARGSGRSVEATVGVLHDRDGQRLGRVVVCRDRTSERRSAHSLESQAEELRSKQDELKEAYKQLVSMNAELEERRGELDALGQELNKLDETNAGLLGDMSHELQTPLVSIRGFTEMILKGRLGTINDEQRKGLELSLKNIDRLIAMIDNLLAISRLEPDGTPLNATTFPLRHVVQEAVDLLRPRMERRKLNFSSAYETLDVVVRADRDMVLQVFLNLLSNAIKFNHEGGRIETVVRAVEPGFVQVQVLDTGVGIPEAERGKIFERFYRVRRESATEGSGLGLAIVHSIITRHGGSIRAEPREGGGTVFTFSLPRAAEESGDGGSRDDAPEEPPAIRIIRR